MRTPEMVINRIIEVFPHLEEHFKSLRSSAMFAAPENQRALWLRLAEKCGDLEEDGTVDTITATTIEQIIQHWGRPQN